MPFIETNQIVITDRAREELGDDFEDLKTSIRNRGLFHPIIINRKDFVLVSGFRRLQCHIDLDIKDIEVKFFEDLTPLEKKLIELEENIHKELTWDEQSKLRNEIHKMNQELHGAAEPSGGRPAGYTSKGWSISDTAESLGISEATMIQDLKLAHAIEIAPNLKKFASRRQAIKAVDQAEESALLMELARRREIEATKETDKSKPFIAVPYILINDDSVNYLKEKVDDETIDMVVFDPPWGIDIHEGGGSRGPRGDKVSYEDDSQRTAIDITLNLLPEIYRTMKEDAHMYMFFGMQFQDFYYDLLTDHQFVSRRLEALKMVVPALSRELSDLAAKFEALPERSWKFHVEQVPLIWVKDGGGFTDYEHKFMPRYEAILFCSKGIKKPFNEVASNVFEYNRPASTERIHTQEKPIDLIQKFIKISSSPDAIILDPCAGSFTTSIAATLSGRRSICIEKDKICYEKGMNRVKGASPKEEPNE
jgi:DNA modification methylase